MADNIHKEWLSVFTDTIVKEEKQAVTITAWLHYILLVKIDNQSLCNM